MSEGKKVKRNKENNRMLFNISKRATILFAKLVIDDIAVFGKIEESRVAVIDCR